MKKLLETLGGWAGGLLGIIYSLGWLYSWVAYSYNYIYFDGGFIRWLIYYDYVCMLRALIWPIEFAIGLLSQ
jgi:hypothetical protein